jgi:hypothetical protein
MKVEWIITSVACPKFEVVIMRHKQGYVITRDKKFLVAEGFGFKWEGSPDQQPLVHCPTVEEAQRIAEHIFGGDDAQTPL